MNTISKSDFENNWLTVGNIVAAQGLSGEVRINSRSDFPERFTKAGQRWLQKGQQAPIEIQLISGKKVPGKNLYITRFAGIKSRNEAEAIVGNNLIVPKSYRPKLMKGEFHLLDLVGLEAKLEEQGNTIGVVTDLLAGGNDLLEIQLLEGKKILIPFVKEIVPVIKIQDGWLLITPPPGLLNL